MVRIAFGKNAKTIEVLQDNYSRKDAQEIAEQNSAKAFGIISGIIKAFDKSKTKVSLSGYQKLYIPHWHIIGESVQEYKRMTPYGFDVKPEVRSITFNRKTIPVDKNEPYINFNAEDHCYEQFSKETLQSALQEKERNLEKYKDCERKKVKNLAAVQDKTTIIAPIEIRASYLVNQVIKDLIKPIQADKIIQEVVEIKRLALILRPVHVFSFRDETGQEKAIEVNAITAAWKKGERMLTSGAKRHLLHEGIFEIGSELASVVIPGAAMAAVVGRHLKHRQDRSKNVRRAKELRKAYESRKKKK